MGSRAFIEERFREAAQKFDVPQELLESVIWLSEEASRPAEGQKRRRSPLEKTRKLITAFASGDNDLPSNANRPSLLATADFPAIEFHALQVENVGPFFGEHIIEFSLNPEAPVTLIEGPNGSGKSTLYKSLIISIFGLEDYVPRQRVYPSSTHELLHKHVSEQRPRMKFNLVFSDDRIPKARVSRCAEFKRAHNETYVRERTWSTLEYNSFAKNTNDDIRAFMSSRIPLALSSFFLFDGDYIAGFLSGAEFKIRPALDDALGIGDVRAAIEDVHKIRTAYEKEIANSREKNEELTGAITERDKLEVQKKRRTSELEKAQGQYAEMKGRLARVDEQLRNLETSFSRPVARQREQLIAKEQQLAADIEKAKQDIRELFSKPASLSPFRPLLRKAHDSSPADVAQLSWLLTDLKHLREQLLIIGKRLMLNPDEAFKEPLALIDNACMKLEPATAAEEFELKLGYAERKKLGVLLGVISRASSMKSVVASLERCSAELINARTELSTLPAPDEDLMSRYEKLNAKRTNENSQFEDCKAKCDTLKEQLQELKTQIGSLNKLIEELTATGADGSDLERICAMTRAVVEALRYFEDSVANDSLGELESLASHHYNDLTNKPDIDWRLQVDLDRKEIIVHDEGSTKHWLLSERSEGEQQVIAISLVRALADLSACRAPIVVDSPTMRLDHTHRTKLAENFFPYVAAQSVVFAGEQELDGEFLERIMPYVGKRYALKRAKAVGESGWSDRSTIEEIPV